MTDLSKLSDRELLELAAEVAGAKITDYSDRTPDHWIIQRGHGWVSWNSLQDAGDALRLATYLCMSVSTGPCEASASTIGGALRGYFPKESTLSSGPEVAVMRVITLAAAEHALAKRGEA